MTTKHEVIALHRKHADWSSGQIADVLGCDSAYVRATFHRNGLTLSKTTTRTAKDKERERCAEIAMMLGAPHVAAAIRGEHP